MAYLWTICTFIYFKRLTFAQLFHRNRPVRLGFQGWSFGYCSCRFFYRPYVQPLV